MKVIVSSRFAVEVVDVLTEDRELIRTTGYESLYYGISWYKDYMFLGKRDLNNNSSSMLVVLDKDLEYVDTIGYEHFGDVHQIQVYDGLLWMTSTLHNGIIIANPETLEYLDIWFPNEYVELKDVNHFNSIWMGKGLIYLVAHNHGGSQLYCCEYLSRELLYTTDMGLGSHNVFRAGDEVCTLSSGNGYVISEKGRVYNLFRNTYPRGLVIGNGFTIVGLSEHVTDRKNRHKERRGAVQLYEQNDEFPFGGTYKKTIELGHGMVLEVRGLDFSDHAHHGTVWAGKHGV